MTTIATMTSESLSVPISAVIPVKNGEKFLGSFLPNLIQNLNVSDEIIIINDGSTDRTVSIISEWAERYKQIRLLNNANIGLISALNFGIKESSNNWIARFDVDDTYAENRIMKQREKISSESVAIFSDYEIMGSGKHSLGKIYSPVFPLACSISLISSQRTAHPSAMINKNAFEFVGGYRSQDFLVEDISLWLRLSRVGEIISVPENLLKYNLNRKSVSMQNRESMKKASRKVILEIGINPIHLKQINEQEIKFHLYDGLPNSQIRALLFIKDILRCQKLDSGFISGKSTVRLIKGVLEHPYKSGVSSIEILRGKLLRECFRRLPIN
jgi:glycosyltransferase involved in cell wall biosynthesis